MRSLKIIVPLVIVAAVGTAFALKEIKSINKALKILSEGEYDLDTEYGDDD